jgi:transposase
MLNKSVSKLIEFVKYGLLENQYHGSIGHLTDNQEIELTDYLKNHLHQRAVEIAARIETYGVNYSVEGVTQLLHRLGFVYKKTKIVPGKVNPGLERCFKRL